MLPSRQVGQCKRCYRTIGWFGYLRRQLNGESEAIRRIAALAEVPLLGSDPLGGMAMSIDVMDAADWTDLGPGD